MPGRGSVGWGLPSRGEKQAEGNKWMGARGEGGGRKEDLIIIL